VCRRRDSSSLISSLGTQLLQLKRNCSSLKRISEEKEQVNNICSYFVAVQVRPNLTSVTKRTELLVAPLIVGTITFRRYKSIL